jgi:CheY-like chemotaxis protein
MAVTLSISLLKISTLMDKLGDVVQRILVIDDEKGILDVVRSVLSRAGFKVEIALNGRKGIQKFDGGAFDLVITDILMPEIDGIEVVKHIRNSDRPYTPIIGCSGTPWLLEEGEFDTVFLKPFPLADLVHAVRHLSRPSGSN